MRILGFAACLAVALTTPALAKNPPEEDKIICKRQQDADTGSHFATTKKVCLRKSEWRQMEDAAESSLRKIREQGGACPTCLMPGSAPGG